MKKKNLIAKYHSQHKFLAPSNPRYREWILQYTESEIKKDVGSGDITTKICFPKPKLISAYIIAKESGILAGCQELEFFFKRLRKFLCQFYKKDGKKIKKGDRICSLHGDVRLLMSLERAALNLLGHMSGVATFTHRIVSQAKKINPRVLITPTRKTLWGLLDKRACFLGGGGTHRLSLDSAVLIKHNHIRASGLTLKNFLQSAMLRQAQYDGFIEVEVGNIRDARIAAEFPVIVLLDNMKPQIIRKTLASIPKHSKALYFEASGGINPKNLKAFLETDVDVIAMGCLTHSAKMVDFSMRVK